MEDEEDDSKEAKDDEDGGDDAYGRSVAHTSADRDSKGDGT